jgi:DeoR/GlpR family transcriptional regulator of sugar metabolism
VLASAEKIGAASPYRVIPLAEASAVITDAPPDNAVVAELRARGVEVTTTAASPGS